MAFRAQELCESRGGRPGLSVPNSPYGLCGRKATLSEEDLGLELRRGGRPGIPVSDSPYGLCGRNATFSLFEYCQNGWIIILFSGMERPRGREGAG